MPPPPPLPQESAASDDNSDQVARVEAVQAPKASAPPQLRSSFSRRRRQPGHSVTPARRRTEPAVEKRDDNIVNDEVFEDELRDDSNVEEDSSSDEE